MQQRSPSRVYAICGAVALNLCLWVSACGDSSSPERNTSDASQTQEDADLSSMSDDAAMPDANVDASDAEPAVQGIGQECETQACPAGLVCGTHTNCRRADPQVCPAICILPVAVGCETDPCPDGTWCHSIIDFETDARTGKCYPRSGQGEACSPPVPGTSTNTCTEGLYCSAVDDGTRDTCLPILPAGASCPEEIWWGVNPCVAGYFCQSEGYSGPETCKPAP